MPKNYDCCYQCKDRSMKEINGKLKSCHAYCKKYKEYVKKVHEEQERIKEQKKLDNDSYSKAWIEYREKLQKKRRNKI